MVKLLLKELGAVLVYSLIREFQSVWIRKLRLRDREAGMILKKKRKAMGLRKRRVQRDAALQRDRSLLCTQIDSCLADSESVLVRKRL